MPDQDRWRRGWAGVDPDHSYSWDWASNGQGSVTCRRMRLVAVCPRTGHGDCSLRVGMRFWAYCPGRLGSSTSEPLVHSPLCRATRCRPRGGPPCEVSLPCARPQDWPRRCPELPRHRGQASTRDRRSAGIGVLGAPRQAPGAIPITGEPAAESQPHRDGVDVAVSGRSRLLVEASGKFWERVSPQQAGESRG
jgi:hypothetical protein